MLRRVLTKSIVSVTENTVKTNPARPSSFNITKRAFELLAEHPHTPKCGEAMTEAPISQVVKSGNVGAQLPKWEQANFSAFQTMFNKDPLKAAHTARFFSTDNKQSSEGAESSLASNDELWPQSIADIGLSKSVMNALKFKQRIISIFQGSIGPGW